MNNHSTEDSMISRQFGPAGYKPVRQQGDQTSSASAREKAKDARDRGRTDEERGYKLQMA